MEFRWGVFLFLAVLLILVFISIKIVVKCRKYVIEKNESNFNFIMHMMLFSILLIIFSFAVYDFTSGELPKYAVVDNNLYVQNEDYTYTLASHKLLFNPPKVEKIYVTSKEDEDLITIHKDSGDEQYKRVYDDQHLYYAPIKDNRTGEYIFEYLGKIKDGIVIKKSKIQKMSENKNKNQ